MANLAGVLRILVQTDANEAQKKLAAFDRQMTETRSKAARAVEAKLGADFNPAAFKAYDAALENARRKSADKSAFRAALGADFNPAGFRAYQREVARADQSTRRLSSSTAGLNRSSRDASPSVGNLGVHITKLVKEAAIISAVGMGAQAISALGAAATATAASLGPLVGVLAAYPTIASAGAQAIGTWKLAFAGIGQAVGGLNEQINKNSQAWKALTPEGKKFAEQLQAMKKPLLDLASTAQKGIMPGLEVGIKAAMANFSVFRKGIADTSKSIGALAQQAGTLIGSKSFGADLGVQMARNNVTIRRLGSAALYLVDALRHIMLAAGPLVDWITRTTVALAHQIDAWAQAGRESGKFAAFFEQTRRVMTEVGHIAANLAIALINIFKGAYPVGQTLLGTLENLSRKFREWTGSAEGQNKIRKFFEDQKPAMIEAGRLVGALVIAFGKLGSGNQVAGLLRALRVDLLPAFTKLVDSTTSAFGPAFIEAAKQIMLIFSQLGGSSGPLVQVVRMFGEFAKVVNWLLQNIPGLAQVIIGALVINRVIAFGAALEAVGKKYLGLTAMMSKPLVPKAAAVQGATAPVAATVPVAPVVAPGAIAKVTSLLKTGLRAGMVGVGLAIGGGLLADIASSLAGQKIGNAIRAAVPLAAVGGGIGFLLGGPAGAAAGVAIGGGIKAALSALKQHASIDAQEWSRNFTAGISINLTPQSTVRIQSQLTALYDSLKRQVASFQVRLKPPEIGAMSPQQIAAAQAKLRSTAWNLAWVAQEAFRLAFSQVKIKTTPVFIADVIQQLNRLPPVARNQAAQMMVQYAAALQAKGELPKNATRQVIAALEKQFPAFTAYVKTQAGGTANAMAQAMRLESARKNFASAIADMRSKYGVFTGQTGTKNSQILSNFITTYNGIRNAVTTKTGVAKREAEKDLRALRDNLRTYLGQAANTTEAKMAAMARSVRNHVPGAAAAAAKSFSDFANTVWQAMHSGAVSTSQGASAIGTVLYKTLKAFGATNIPGALLAAAYASLPKLSSKPPGNLKATGGFVERAATGKLIQIGQPGQAGRDTVPLNVGGTPIAVGAGEQVAVFNRHQQAVANQALAPMGGLPGLFHKVNRPNYMAQGGIVPQQLATGGTWRSVRHSLEDDVGKRGAYGIISRYGYSELSNNQAGPGPWDFSALGNLPPHTHMRIRKGGHEVVAQKQDVGRGSPSFHPLMGIYPGTAEQLAIRDNGVVQIQRADGVPLTLGGAAGAIAQAWTNLVAPKIAGGGTVAKIVQAAMGLMTDAANKYGQAHMPAPAVDTGTFGGPPAGGPAVVGGKLAGWPELTGTVRGLLAALLQAWPSLRIGTAKSGHSKYTDSGNISDHWYGHAADVVGPQSTMDAAGRWATSHIGRAMKQGIHNPTLSINRGQIVPASYWGAATWARHHDHLHIAGYTRGGFPIFTFARGGMATETFDPIDMYNQSAADRRRGKATRREGTGMSYGGEFEQGGVVPGPTGKPTLVTAHGGEVVLPAYATGGTLFGRLNESRNKAIAIANNKAYSIRLRRPTGGVGLGPGAKGLPKKKPKGMLAGIPTNIIAEYNQVRDLIERTIPVLDERIQERMSWFQAQFPNATAELFYTPPPIADKDGNLIDQPPVRDEGVIARVRAYYNDLLKWNQQIVADYDNALKLVNQLIAEMEKAIKQRQDQIKKWAAEMSQNSRQIGVLQDSISTLKKAKPPNDPKHAAAFKKATATEITKLTNQINKLKATNKSLTGKTDTLKNQLDNADSGLFARLNTVRSDKTDIAGLTGSGGKREDYRRTIWSLLNIDIPAASDEAIQKAMAAATPTTVTATGSAEDIGAGGETAGGETGAGIDTGGTDVGSSAADAAAQAALEQANALLKQQLVQAQQAYAVSQAQYQVLTGSTSALPRTNTLPTGVGPSLFPVTTTAPTSTTPSFSTSFSALPLLQSFAAGGTVGGSGWALVGERGPEITKLPVGSRVLNANQTASAMQQGPIEIRVVVQDGAVNIDKIKVIANQEAQVVTRREARFAGRGLPGRGGGVR